MGIVQDYGLAVLTSAKAMVGTVVDLLYNGATRAGEIVEAYEAPLKRTEYLSTVREFASEETFSGQA